MWPSITTRPVLPSTPFAAGGRSWVVPPIGRLRRCSLSPTRAEATARLRLWKLQQFATRTGLTITVCHFPLGTSKWNRIEHRLFSHIATNWRGEPLVSLAAVVSLIAATRSTTGLRVRSEINRRPYPKGVVVREDQMHQVRLRRHAFHGEWNYTIRPKRKSAQ